MQGPVRDMWRPECFGLPGRVRSPDYYCAREEKDFGGVHHNSGIPAHAFALAADGGSYNGFEVEGLGLARAINIFWRAQTHYFTQVMPCIIAITICSARSGKGGIYSKAALIAPHNSDKHSIY
jgi:Zn-dependent metalloprotease